MASQTLWTEAQIQSMVDNKVGESITLDYKACDALRKTDPKKNEVSKDVSAFANSAGGTTIYGVIENNHLPTSLDVGFDPADISREWLEQVINSRIQPRIEGIVIHQIPRTGTGPTKVLYVVDIPQATTRAPHQASDNRYYKRHNFEARPMEHYEVLDVMRRATSPDLRLGAEISETMQFPLQQQSESYTNSILVIFTVTNYSPVLANYFAAEIFVDNKLNVQHAASGEVGSHKVELVVDGERREFASISYVHGGPSHSPIYGDIHWVITSSPVYVQLPLTILKEQAVYEMYWRVQSPGMTPTSGALQLKAAVDKVDIVEVPMPDVLFEA